MENTIQALNLELDQYHLLKHEFYKEWSAGKLSLNSLKEYAAQYYHHVSAFPRYISTIHSRCEDIANRQILLGNLVDEEQGEENHPELWLRFAEGLGVERQSVKSAKLNKETRNLIDGFFRLANTSYAKGLGALYAYERQVPEVAKSKIEGLKKFYDLNDKESLKFFEVHMVADEWHAQECADLIEVLPENDRKDAMESAVEAAKLLWGFLDGMKIQCH